VFGEIQQRLAHRNFVGGDRLHHSQEPVGSIRRVVELFGHHRAAVDWCEQVAPDMSAEVSPANLSGLIELDDRVGDAIRDSKPH